MKERMLMRTGTPAKMEARGNDEGGGEVSSSLQAVRKRSQLASRRSRPRGRTAGIIFPKILL